eukprot:5695937-Prymnesium_polylepis.1
MGRAAVSLRMRRTPRIPHPQNVLQVPELKGEGARRAVDSLPVPFRGFLASRPSDSFAVQDKTWALRRPRRSTLRRS